MKTQISIAKKLNHDFAAGPFEIFDDHYNETYFETIGGFWEKREYDIHNNEIYFENSDGYWEKYGFDKKNTIYFENSKGELII